MDFEDDKTEYLKNDDPQTAIIEKITDEEELDAMEELIKEGTLYEPRNNTIRFTNKND